MNIQQKTEGKLKSYKFPMKYCTEKMFTDLDIEPADKITLQRLCPDLPVDYDLYKVQDFITNKVNQTSFSIQIR